MLEGGCSCGTVRYRLTSEPLFIHCCHCLNCQRQTGSAFVINLLIETDRVEAAGRRSRARWTCLGTTAVRSRSFAVGVPGGGLQPLHAPGRAVRPRRDARRSVGDRARRPHLHQIEAPWVTLPDSVPAFDVYYDLRALARQASSASRRSRRRPAPTPSGTLCECAWPPCSAGSTSARASGSPCPSSAGSSSHSATATSRRTSRAATSCSRPRRRRRNLAPRLERAIGKVTGLDVPVLVRTGRELAKVVAANPYAVDVTPRRSSSRSSARRSSPRSSGSATSTATRGTN